MADKVTYGKYGNFCVLDFYYKARKEDFRIGAAIVYWIGANSVVFLYGNT